MPYTKVGGARIAGIRTDFAELWCDAEELILTARWIGEYCFRPEDVHKIEKYKSGMGWGVRILHCVEDKPRQIVLTISYFDVPEDVIEGIHDAGFIPAGKRPGPRDGPEIPLSRIKLLLFAAAWLAWTVTWGFAAGMIIDRFAGHSPIIDWGGLVATELLMLLLAFRVHSSPRFVSLLLIRGRNAGEIQPYLHFARIMMFGYTAIVFVVLAMLVKSKGAQ